MERKIVKTEFEVTTTNAGKIEGQEQALRRHDVVGRSEQLSCGRNITTCVFYKDGGKCSNLEYCRDQTT